MNFIVTVIGVVLVVEGIPWFLSPAGVRRTLAQLTALSDQVLRVLGLLCMLAGLLAVFLARP